MSTRSLSQKKTSQCHWEVHRSYELSQFVRMVVSTVAVDQQHQTSKVSDKHFREYVRPSVHPSVCTPIYRTRRLPKRDQGFTFVLRVCISRSVVTQSIIKLCSKNSSNTHVRAHTHTHNVSTHIPTRHGVQTPGSILTSSSLSACPETSRSSYPVLT